MRAGDSQLSAEVASAALTLAVVAAATAAALDAGLLLARGAGVAAALAGALAAAALAALGALVIAPFAVVVVRAGARGGRLATAAALPGAAGFALAMLATRPARLAREDVRLGAALLFAAGLVVCVIAARARRRLWARLVAAGGALVAVAELSLERAAYPALRDLAVYGAVAAMAAWALGTPAAARLRERSLRWLTVATAATIVLAALLPLLVDALHPSWRGASVRAGGWGARLMRVAHQVVDLDGDGFSSVAWGGDCDDLDGGRHPTAIERGRDENCNGMTPPAGAGDAERGLVPDPGGSPELSEPADLVLLISGDSLRVDVINEAITPNLARLAREGLVLERGYAGGTRTSVSVPVMLRPGPRGAAVPERLRAAGIASAAILGVKVHAEMREVLAGFERVESRLDMDGRELSDRAIALLAARPPGRFLLWLHYGDPHVPYRLHDEVEPRAPPGADVVRRSYLEEVAYFDLQVGRVVDAVRADGRWRRVVVIVTSDHGEALGEHGVGTHSVGTWEVLVHVPILVVAPGLAPGRSQTLVSHTDLPATLLGAFGLAGAHPDAERWGRSWWRLRDDPARRLHELVVVHSARLVSGAETAEPVLGIIAWPDKLSRSLADGLEELYDLAADPRETRDLSLARPETVLRLRRKLAVYQDLWGSDGRPF